MWTSFALAFAIGEQEYQGNLLLSRSLQEVGKLHYENLHSCPEYQRQVRATDSLHTSVSSSVPHGVVIGPASTILSGPCLNPAWQWLPRIPRDSCTAHAFAITSKSALLEQVHEDMEERTSLSLTLLNAPQADKNFRTSRAGSFSSSTPSPWVS